MVYLSRASFLTLTLLAASCSKSSSSSGVATGLGTSLTDVMDTALSSLDDALPGDSTFKSARFANIGETNYDTLDIQIFGPSYFATPKEFVQYVMNKDTDVDPGDGMGLINRFKQKIASGMCPIMGLHPDANGDGIPDVGSGTFTLPDFNQPSVQSSITALCPSANVDSLIPASGVDIAYVVSDVSSEPGSLYDIKSEIDFGDNGSVDNILYFKADGAIIQFAFAEVSSGIIESATLYEYDGTTLKFDFHGGDQDGHYRILFNENTEDLTVYAHAMQDVDNAVYMGFNANKNLTIAALTLQARKTSVDIVTNGQACVDVSNDFTWDSDFVTGMCSSITGEDFSVEPAVVSESRGFPGTAESALNSTVRPLFSSSSEVYTSGILN